MLKRLLKRWLDDQHSQLTVIDRTGANRRVVYETREWIEAPNWSPDGQWLVFNGGGKLFRIAANNTGTSSDSPQLIDTGSINDITNDHLISPDGQQIYFTAGGCIYAVPFTGGAPRKVSTDHLPNTSVQYYLHGISPDGRTLSCTGVDPGRTTGALAIHTLPADGGSGTQLTHTDAAIDGPEFSADGHWIYFNAEINARHKGHSQLFRMLLDGTGIEQLTFDERVNWFPHLARDGQTLVYLSYPPLTQGHPANMDVMLRRMPTADGEATTLIAFFGGQGSINSNSWAPDSQRLAYVAYPTRKHRA